MKKVRLTIEQKHPKGNIPKGAIYEWSEHRQMYLYRQKGKVVSTVNDAAVDAFPFFERIVE
jgi:hypothetical protein